jgi:hypothetical protein
VGFSKWNKSWQGYVKFLEKTLKDKKGTMFWVLLITSPFFYLIVEERDGD